MSLRSSILLLVAGAAMFGFGVDFDSTGLTYAGLAAGLCGVLCCLNA